MLPTTLLQEPENSVDLMGKQKNWWIISESFGMIELSFLKYWDIYLYINVDKLAGFFVHYLA